MTKIDRNRVETDTAYLNYIADFLSVVKDSTVLELASFSGWHTKLMLDLGAKQVICIEPNKDSLNGDGIDAVYADERVTLHCCTANDYYSNKATETVDVVTCMGLLYHLHSPIHLLEQIINKSSPKYIVIETTYNTSSFLSNEVYNTPGCAYNDKNITMPIQKNMPISMEDIIRCISTTNYKVVKYEHCRDKFTAHSKKHISIGLFERIGN